MRVREEALQTQLGSQPDRPQDVGFHDLELARRRLSDVRALAGDALAEGMLTQLVDVPEPDRTLLAIERLLRGAEDPARLARHALGGPRRLHNVVRVFASSPYLTELVITRPELLDVLARIHRNATPHTLDQLEASIGHFSEGLWSGAGAPERLDREAQTEAMEQLHAFQQGELLRLGASDLLVLADLPTITTQVSALATAIVRSTLEIAHRSIEDAPPLDRFAVLALGKLGGWELNYCSDIDLVFLAQAEATSYWALARRVTDLLTGGRGPMLYRVDLRLRPWGRDGALVQGADAQLRYLQQHARTSEQQALIKATAIAGDRTVAARFLEAAQGYLYREWDAERLREDVAALKGSIEDELRRGGVEWGQVKTGEGSIRDVEFVAQFLQLRWGYRFADDQDARLPEPSLVAGRGLRSPTTLEALRALSEHGLLLESDYRTLVTGYVFLRTVEHDLQLVGNRPEHRLPTDPRRLDHLARRLGFSRDGGAERFLRRLGEHQGAVREVYSRLLAHPERKAAGARRSSNAAEDTLLMPATYRRTFSPQQQARHREMAARLEQGANVAIELEPAEQNRCRLELVAFDALGSLSALCGLLYAYGFNILDGQVFTAEATGKGKTAADRRVIVDVFTLEIREGDGHSVEPLVQRRAGLLADLEAAYAKLRAGARAEVQASIAKRVALRLAAGDHGDEAPPPLYPVDIRVDNEASERHTVLHIEGLDTVGFLYELTNALALSKLNIELMQVRSSGSRVRDTLWVTDAHGRKLTDAPRLEKVRLTTVLTKHFTHLLPRAPDPAKALLAFRHFLGDLFDREDWRRDIASLERPAVLDRLTRLLGVSDFLWEDLLRMQHETLFPILSDVEHLSTARPRRDLQRLLRSELASSEDPVAALNRFKDREQFRIDMRRILGYARTFEQFSLELTELAEILCGETLRLAHRNTVERYGTPVDERGRGVAHALFALGKFGGRELGFASDLELLFVYSGEGQCRNGGDQREARELFARMVEVFLRTLHTRRQGTFAIDLRLRPYGHSGPLATSVNALSDYFQEDGDAWPYERQGLVKLRYVAGQAALGRKVEALRDRLAYRGPRVELAAVRALRERQVRHLVRPGTLNAKFSSGCLVDVEYLVQLLQLRHGRSHAAARTTNTLGAIRALHDLGALDAHDVERLAGAYQFFRRLIDGLRMVHGHARDLTVPPTEDETFRFLARRLELPPLQLARQLELHTSTVPRLYDELLG